MNRVSTSYPPRYPQGYPPPSGPDPRRVDDPESIILTWQTLLLLARLRRPEGPCPAARSRPLGQLRAWEHHSNSCGMSVAGVPSHQQHLSCPRHERSLYRMSKRSRPPTSQRGKGPYLPSRGLATRRRAARPWHRGDPSKAAESLRLRVLSAVCPHTALLRIPLISEYRSRMSPLASGRTYCSAGWNKGRTEGCRLYGHRTIWTTVSEETRKLRIQLWASLGGVSVTSAGLRSVSRETVAPLVAGKPHHWKWLADIRPNGSE